MGFAIATPIQNFVVENGVAVAPFFVFRKVYPPAADITRKQKWLLAAIVHEQIGNVLG